MRTLFVAAVLLTAALNGAVARAEGEAYPEYDLKVAFDIPRARIIGTATVDAPEGAKLSIHRGDLRLVSVTTGEQRIKAANEASRARWNKVVSGS